MGFFFQKKKPAIRVKTKRELFIEFLKRSFFWLIGTFIVAVALEGFLLPNKIIDGGVIGLSMMLSYITHWNLGLLIFVINIPFIIMAYKALGKKFVINTIFATAVTAFELTICLNSSLIFVYIYYPP